MYVLLKCCCYHHPRPSFGPGGMHRAIARRLSRRGHNTFSIGAGVSASFLRCAALAFFFFLIVGQPSILMEDDWIAVELVDAEYPADAWRA